MNLGLSLKFSQNLSLTPQLQMAIKLLQLSSVELQDALLEQVNENPFLSWDAQASGVQVSATGAIVQGTGAESYGAGGMQTEPRADTHTSAENSAEPREASESSHTWEDTDGAFSAFETTQRDGRSADANDATDDSQPYLGWVAASETTLLAHLEQQLRLSNCSPIVAGVSTELLQALTPAGWFEEDAAQLAQTVAHSLDVPNDALLAHMVGLGIALIQDLDPPGVGAFSLQHCLLLQLRHPQPPDCVLDVKMPVFTAAQRILSEGFDLLSTRDRVGLKRLLKIKDETLAAALSLIRSLDPKPGLAFAPTTVEYALPEVLVVRVLIDGEPQWQARLNPAVVPPLRVQETHAKYIKNKSLPPNVSEIGRAHV